ncbi:MAG: stage II sporulation protein M, partial [Chitinophagales bacterium]|nr:stage II sporulation protein M [Chitinophagales bacterium]
MKETRFIKQNKEKWSELEGVLKQSKKSPDKLSELFVKVTDDLSYSRTFYPNRYVRVYLNNLAQRIFFSIYKNKRDRRRGFLNFWKEELPLLVYQSRKEFLLSFLIFSLSVAIGVFSSIYDHDFARLILGDGYVEMTKEFIKSGDPMKVYKQQNGFDMLLGITINNLYVSFQTFIYGLFFTIATIGMLLNNGIMVGAFQYFFIERGLFWESFLTIWMHGTLEISSIIISGAAGIVLGKGLVFPGTYSRLQSLQISAQRALKIFVGIAPIIVTAAIIESFITRITDVPDVLRLFVILFSLFFILAYFVWYPIQKSRNTKVPDAIRLPPNRNQQFDTTMIRNNGEIFGDIFIFLKKSFYQIFINSIVISAAASTIIWIFNPGQWQSTLVFSSYQFLQLGSYFDYGFPVLFIVNTLAFAINILLVMRMVKMQ